MKTHLQFLLLPVFIFLFSIILFAQKIPSSINKEIETKDKNVDSVRIQSQYMGDAHNTDIYKSKKAPAKFTAKFVTTKGEFEVIAERNLSPLAVDRFYTLIRSNYFKNIPIYRVMKNFVAQFGTVNGHLDTLWSKEVILDEPVRRSNDTGTIAFARAGKNTRGTQLFINLKHNSKPQLNL